jgi:starch synthase (maltosyl-transferring)
MRSTQERPDLTISGVFPLMIDRERAEFRRLVRDGAAQPEQNCRDSTAHSAIASSGCPTSPRWASMFSISRRSIRSASTNSKGRNNSLVAEPGDPGSFYAIGSRTAVTQPCIPSSARSTISERWSTPAPLTGSTSRSTSRSNARPIIPGSSRIREWFKKRPDGSMRYAENPPKKYEDIVNPDFGCDDAEALVERACATSSCSGSNRA